MQGFDDANAEGALPEDKDLIRPDSPSEQIESYLDEIHADSLKVFTPLREQARLNELYYLGKQDRFYNPTTRAIESFWQIDRITYRPHNLLRNPIDTQVARILQSMPSATSKPTTPDAAARGAASIAADYMEYQEFEQALDKQNGRVVLKNLLHGTAGYKIIYSKSQDAVKWQPVTVFDLLIDPDASELNECRWVTFIDYKDKYSALGLARKYDPAYSLDLIEETTYKMGVGGEERTAVEIHEVWHLPSERVPLGLYAVLVGGKLVHVREYPYMLPARDGSVERDEFGEPVVDEFGQPVPALEGFLPLVLCSAGPSENDTVLGTTTVSDAVPIQRQYNENESRLQHLKTIATDLKLFGPETEISQFRVGANQFITSLGNQSMRSAWLNPPQIHPILFSDKEDLRSMILEVLGVSGLVSGQVNPKSGTAARTLAYVDEMDSLKLQALIRSVQDMLESGWELDLKLAQRFLSDERMLSMPSADGVKMLSFRGGDLRGVTVRLEPRSGLEKFADQKAKGVVEQAQAGLVDPAQAQEALRSGHTKTAYDAANERIVMGELDGLLMGGIQPTFEAEPQIALRVLKDVDALAVSQGRADLREAVKMLVAGYVERAKPPEQPAPPPPGQMQPGQVGEISPPQIPGTPPGRPELPPVR